MRKLHMLGMYYALGACSMAAHIVLEESGETYEPIHVDLVKGEQRTEAYLKLNPTPRRWGSTNYTAFKDRMLQRPGVRSALDDEKIKL
jgi:hypothetical protein